MPNKQIPLALALGLAVATPAFAGPCPAEIGGAVGGAEAGAAIGIHLGARLGAVVSGLVCGGSLALVPVTGGLSLLPAAGSCTGALIAAHQLIGSVGGGIAGAELGAKVGRAVGGTQCR